MDKNYKILLNFFLGIPQKKTELIIFNRKHSRNHENN